MRKSIHKVIKGNTLYFKHESEKRRFTKDDGKTFYGYNRGHKWVCPDDRYGICEYCLEGRLHKSHKNIERADEMLLEEKYVSDESR